MINGLNIPSYNLKIVGNGLQLTGTTVKGKGCDIKCDKKKKTKRSRTKDIKIIFLINI